MSHVERAEDDVSRGTRRPGRVITVVNQKGGVGKTTTAVNLAAGLACAERSTLLVDLDPQGNATTGLGVRKEGLYPTIYSVLLQRDPIDRALQPTALPTLSIVPADIDLVGAETTKKGASLDLVYHVRLRPGESPTGIIAGLTLLAGVENVGLSRFTPGSDAGRSPAR